jgi:two-component sensor histidine kinase
VQRCASDGNVFYSSAGVGRFVAIAAISTALSAIIGPTSLYLGGYVEQDKIVSVELTWWLGDLTGALVVTPALVLWTVGQVQHLENRVQILLLSYLATIGVGLIAFSPIVPHQPVRDLLGFLVILPLLWAGLRLEPHHTATIALILSAFAVWGTLRNDGPFSASDLNQAFLFLNMFMISAAVPSLALSSELVCRRREEEHGKQRALETEVLWKASLQVASGGSFEELLRASLKCICRVTGWPAGHVYLPDNIRAPRILNPSSVWHFEDAKLEPVAAETETISLQKGEGLPGQIWERGEPVWIPDISESQNLPRKTTFLKHGLHAAFGFPLFAEGRLQAVLEFLSTAKQPPDEHLLRVVQSIGEQLGRVLERQRAHEQQQILLKELSHRVGNALAIIQSMFRRSIQHAANMQALETAFDSRLMNLAATYRHLTDSNWQSANIDRLVRSALEPYCSSSFDDCDLSGPDVDVPPSMALFLTMVLHELATNASKHGAFACHGGRLRVFWNEAISATGTRELTLNWEEVGVTRRSESAGTGYGFGLMDSSTKALGATLKRDFRADGISVRIVIPVVA